MKEHSAVRPSMQSIMKLWCDGWDGQGNGKSLWSVESAIIFGHETGTVFNVDLRNNDII